jgi:hypothetical protein
MFNKNDRSIVTLQSIEEVLEISLKQYIHHIEHHFWNKSRKDKI